MSWTRTTAPTGLPVSIADVRGLQARLDDTSQDDLWASFIETATSQAEEYLGRGLMQQGWTVRVSDWWDTRLPLPMAAPLMSIDAVTYYAADGTLTTLASSYYQVDQSAQPAALVKAPRVVWPALQSDRTTDLVQVRYTVGFATAPEIPERIRQGIRIYATALDDSRNGVDVDLVRARQAAASCWGDRVFVSLECLA
jgi:uncharacterized phiE125 gp8 family phage protein